MSIDRLQELIIKKENPTVAGLDPRPDYIPPQLIEKHKKEGRGLISALASAYLDFNMGLIDALYDIVPAVKPQSACYEQLGWEGVRALGETIKYAKAKGLYVICDAKRGDIGSTAEAYSEAYFGTIKDGENEEEPFGCDALTINAYLGSDGVSPFLKTCRERDKAIFALVKTSNPSSAELQDLVIDGRRLYQHVGELIESLAGDTVGRYGYSCAGAVVGATWPGELEMLRARLKKTFFLVPGYGAQGGTAADVGYAFDERGYGAVVNSSRGIICAWQKTGNEGRDFGEAARAEAIKMCGELRAHINFGR